VRAIGLDTTQLDSTGQSNGRALQEEREGRACRMDTDRDRDGWGRGREAERYSS
jgi:hypothetical protein